MLHLKLAKLINIAVVGGGTLITLGLANPSYAASITTTFAGGTGAGLDGSRDAGNMFNITTFGNALKVTNLFVNVDRTDSFTLQVYTKSGTYVGSENNAGAWTLVSS